MDHHDDAQFFAAGWTQWSGESGGTLEAHIILAEAADQAFDQASLSSFVIAEQQVAAAAFDSDDLTGSHTWSKAARAVNHPVLNQL